MGSCVDPARLAPPADDLCDLLSRSYALTGDIVVGSAVALVEPAVNTVAYYLHERVWERIRRYRAARGGRGSGTAMPMAA